MHYKIIIDSNLSAKRYLASCMPVGALAVIDDNGNSLYHGQYIMKCGNKIISLSNPQLIDHELSGQLARLLSKDTTVTLKVSTYISEVGSEV